MTEPVVSVVVATRNRRDLLGRLVDAITAQGDAGPLQLVIVDDASEDATPEELARLASSTPLDVRIIRLPNAGGPGVARNAGWQAATAPAIAFTDDDCVPQPGWLAALLDELTRADLVQGRTEPNPEQRHLLGGFARTISVPRPNGYYQTCNVAYTRSLLERIHGFDPNYRHVAEDTDLAWRAIEANARTAFRTDALVFHDVRPVRFWQHVRTSWKWQGVVLAVRRHPALRQCLHSRWFWKQSHPPVIAAAVGLALVLLPGDVVRRSVAGLLTIPYLRLRTSRVPLWPGRKRRIAWLPAAFVADLNEVAVMVAGSLRFRRFLL